MMTLSVIKVNRFWTVNELTEKETETETETKSKTRIALLRN